MITDIEFRSEIGPDLDRSKLNSYWAEYFSFLQDAPHLHSLSEAELQKVINISRIQARPYIDSQRAISEILNSFGTKHNFHRQFNEIFATAKPSQVLGMQLYELVAQDHEWWVYFPTKHTGHAFPHATYFMPKQDAHYQNLVRRHMA
jgi:hypothetical protein